MTAHAQSPASSPIKPDAAKSARIFGCTVEQAKRLMARNAEQMRQMADRARELGRKVNGYSEAELRQSATDYAEAAR